MVVQGDFDYLSLAIYGTIVADIPSSPDVYEPQPLPSFEPVALSRALDPANSEDPSALGRSLLDSMPDSPALEDLITRTLCPRYDMNEHATDRDVSMSSGNVLQDILDSVVNEPSGGSMEDIIEDLRHELTKSAGFEVSGLF
jgi:hypothetical protein